MWEQLRRQARSPRPEDSRPGLFLQAWSSWGHQLRGGYSSISTVSSNGSVAPGIDVDRSAHVATEPEAWETGISWFKLVVATAFIPIGLIFIILLFRARNAFEIRARSARLVVLTGINVLVSMVSQIPIECYKLFARRPNVLLQTMALYFSLVGIACCYISRMIRLAVVFNTPVRRRFPWLISERRHVIACLLIPTIIATVVPLVDYLSIVVYGSKAIPRPLRRLSFVNVVSRQVWMVQVVFESVLLMIYPAIRNVDDIFSISLELRVLSVWLLSTSVAVKVAEVTCPRPVIRALNSYNLLFISALVAFLFTMAEPLRRLTFSQHGPSREVAANVLDRRKLFVSRCEDTQDESQQEIEHGKETQEIATTVAAAPAVTPQRRLGLQEQQERQGRQWPAEVIDGIWTYEHVAAVPEAAAAFEEFARRALCRESVLFLQKVSRYQRCEFGDDMEFSASDEEADLAAFQEITRTFIFDGSPDEINLSAQDKKAIMDLYNGGKPAFQALGPQERRFVFADAYIEIRYMLEANLMTRFVRTKEFRREQLVFDEPWGQTSPVAV